MKEKRDKTKKNKIIWRDRLGFFIWGIYLFIFLSFLDIGIGLFSDDLSKLIILTVIGGVILSLLSYFIFRNKSIRISNEGIFFYQVKLLGNYNLKYFSRITFLDWGKINKINIENHYIGGGRIISLTHFLTIFSSNKKYKILLKNPEGFIQALKKLNMYHLLSKDSKYK